VLPVSTVAPPHTAHAATCNARTTNNHAAPPSLLATNKQTNNQPHRRLLTDEDPALRERLIQVLFQGGKFQWARLTNLIQLAKEGSGSKTAAIPFASASGNSFSGEPLRVQPLSLQQQGSSSSANGSSSNSAGLDLSDTVKDAARLLLLDEKLRQQVVMALTEDNQLHVAEVREVLALLQGDVNPGRLVQQVVRDLPSIGRQVMLSWADKVLV
jgi:hypothetical protein